MLRNKKTLFYVVLIVVLLTLPFMMRNDYYTYIADLIVVYSIAAIGVAIIMRSGRLPVAQAAFAGIGAYTTAMLATRYGLGFWATLPISVVFAGIVGLLIGLFSLRLAGFFFAISTIAVSEVFVNVVHHTPYFGKEPGIHGVGSLGVIELGGLVIDFRQVVPFYYIGVLFLAIAIYISYRMEHSKIGNAIAALGDDEIMAQSCGIDNTRTRLIACVVGTALGGLAGCLLCYLNNGAAPTTFATLQSVMIVLMCILGGTRYLFGPIVGTAILIPATVGTSAAHAIGLLIYGLIFLCVIYFIPDGLIPRVQSLISFVNRKWLKRNQSYLKQKA